MGGGGGSTGAVSWPAYLMAVHGAILGSVPTTSISDVVNGMLGNSPFSGVFAFDPDTYMSGLETPVDDFFSMIAAIVNFDDWNTAFAEVVAHMELGTNSPDTTTLDTTTLDSTAQDTSVLETTTLDTTIHDTTSLDTTTLDTTTLDQLTNTDATNDTNDFDTIMSDIVTNSTLPKFQAGMLNIGAINTSSYVIGAALIGAFKDRDVAKYGGELRYRNNQINAEHARSYREITARHQINYRDLTSRLQMSYRELTSRLDMAYREITARHNISFREIEAKLKEVYRDIEARYKVTFRDLDARLHQSYRELSVRLGISFRDLEARHKIAYQGRQVELFMNRERASVANTAESLKMLMQSRDLRRSAVALNTETARIHTVAKKEEADENIALKHYDSLWDAEAYTYLNNAVAAIQGGIHPTGWKKPTPVQSAIGGAVSGAALGAVAFPENPAIGAAVGAVGGIGLGLLARQ